MIERLRTTQRSRDKRTREREAKRRKKRRKTKATSKGKDKDGERGVNGRKKVPRKKRQKESIEESIERRLKQLNRGIQRRKKQRGYPLSFSTRRSDRISGRESVCEPSKSGDRASLLSTSSDHQDPSSLSWSSLSNTSFPPHHSYQSDDEVNEGMNEGNSEGKEEREGEREEGFRERKEGINHLEGGKEEEDETESDHKEGRGKREKRTKRRGRKERESARGEEEDKDADNGKDGESEKEKEREGEKEKEKEKREAKKGKRSMNRKRKSKAKAKGKEKGKHKDEAKDSIDGPKGKTTKRKRSPNSTHKTSKRKTTSKRVKRVDPNRPKPYRHSFNIFQSDHRQAVIEELREQRLREKLERGGSGRDANRDDAGKEKERGKKEKEGKRGGKDVESGDKGVKPLEGVLTRREKLKLLNEVNTALGERWKKADPRTRAKYNRLAEQDRIRYFRELETYTPSPGYERVSELSIPVVRLRKGQIQSYKGLINLDRQTKRGSGIGGKGNEGLGKEGKEGRRANDEEPRGVLTRRGKKGTCVAASKIGDEGE